MIQQFISQGIPINDIYVEILAESMRQIGEMWHTAKITVDTEHYCTSVTQMAMTQHLITCKEITASIRQEFPDLKIAVGGKAFEITHNRPFSGNIKNGFLQSGTYRL